jgi:hypothetical protein
MNPSSFKKAILSVRHVAEKLLKNPTNISKEQDGEAIALHCFKTSTLK